MFWPFSVKVAIERLNFLQLDLDGDNPTEKFYNIKIIKPNAYEYHTFGCPIYVLNSKLQLGSIGLPKWEPHSQVGAYLDHSPMHAGSVALIINPVTWHVSPQSTVSHMRDEKYLQLGTRCAKIQ